MNIAKKVEDIIDADNMDDAMYFAREIMVHLGDNAYEFDVYDFDEEALSYFAEQIESNRYDARPFVILARYVPKTARARFTKLTLKYGQASDPMGWEMRAEVCRTLPFLNCLPEHSMRYLGKRLEDYVFNDEPFYSAIHAMPFFYKHTDAAINQISKIINQKSVCDTYKATYFELLTRIITTKSQAEKLLPIFEEKYMEDYRSLDHKALTLSRTDDYEVRFFYGHLKMLAKFG